MHTTARHRALEASHLPAELKKPEAQDSVSKPRPVSVHTSHSLSEPDRDREITQRANSPPVEGNSPRACPYLPSSGRSSREQLHNGRLDWRGALARQGGAHAPERVEPRQSRLARLSPRSRRGARLPASSRAAALHDLPPKTVAPLLAWSEERDLCACHLSSPEVLAISGRASLDRSTLTW